MLHALNEQLSRMLTSEGGAAAQQASPTPLTIVAVRWPGPLVPKASHNIPNVLSFKMAQTPADQGYDEVVIGRMGMPTDERRGSLFVDLPHNYIRPVIGTIKGNTITCTRQHMCRLMPLPGSIDDLQSMLSPQSSTYGFVQWIPTDVPTEILPGTILLIHTKSVGEMQTLPERLPACYWVLYCLPDLPPQDVYLQFILNAHRGALNANMFTNMALLRRDTPLSLIPASTAGVTPPPVKGPPLPMYPRQPPPGDDDPMAAAAGGQSSRPPSSWAVLSPPSRPTEPPDRPLVVMRGGHRPPPPGRGRGAPAPSPSPMVVRGTSHHGSTRGRGSRPPPPPPPDTSASAPPPPPPSQPRPPPRQWYQGPRPP